MFGTCVRDVGIFSVDFVRLFAFRVYQYPIFGLIQGDSKFYRQIVKMDRTCETDDIYRNIRYLKNLFK